MGLTFYYSGRIRQYEKIDEMILEAEDISKSLDWKYDIIDDNKLKGIILSPKGSEPLSLTFVPDGRLCSIISIMVNEPDGPFYYTAFTKTQFAGPDTHIALLKLLRYLSDKYFSEIEVNDEGLYWGTWDKKMLLEQFAKYNYALDTLATALSEMKAVAGETPQSLADRIEDTLKKKRNGGD